MWPGLEAVGFVLDRGPGRWKPAGSALPAMASPEPWGARWCIFSAGRLSRPPEVVASTVSQPHAAAFSSADYFLLCLKYLKSGGGWSLRAGIR
jgi:hypothetical protein